jgi:hypothetical protein
MNLHALYTMEELNELKGALPRNPPLMVKDLWLDSSQQQRWRQWKLSHQELGVPENIQLQQWQTQATNRKILHKEGDDILRWGYTPIGTFTIKEAYSLQGSQQEQRTNRIWSKVWNPALWPKISTFLWLVVHNRTLTWDNLQKRGFIGPSCCVLCLQHEETKEHLFNGCQYSQQIWDYGAQLMRRSNRRRGSINDTIDNWSGTPFHNPILNHIWTILPGFTLWQIWKERNKRIFHSQSSPPTATWEKIKSLIQETTRSKPWSEEDQKCRQEEQGILQNWQPVTSNPSTQSGRPRPPDSPSSWSPPPAHFIKVNFDGASKGNPGPAGYGVVLPPDGVTARPSTTRGGEAGRGVNKPTGPRHLAH